MTLLKIGAMPPARRDANPEGSRRAVVFVIAQGWVGARAKQYLDDLAAAAEIRPMKCCAAEESAERKIRIMRQQLPNNRCVAIAASKVQGIRNAFARAGRRRRHSCSVRCPARAAGVRSVGNQCPVRVEERANPIHVSHTRSAEKI